MNKIVNLPKIDLSFILISEYKYALFALYWEDFILMFNDRFLLDLARQFCEEINSMKQWLQGLSICKILYNLIIDHHQWIL